MHLPTNVYTCTFVTLFIQSSSFLTCDNLTRAGSPILETGSHYEKKKENKIHCKCSCICVLISLLMFNCLSYTSFSPNNKTLSKAFLTFTCHVRLRYCRAVRSVDPPPPPGVNDSVLGSESVYERHSVVPCLILPQTKIVPIYSPNIIGAIFCL